MIIDMFCKKGKKISIMSKNTINNPKRHPNNNTILQQIRKKLLKEKL